MLNIYITFKQRHFRTWRNCIQAIPMAKSLFTIISFMFHLLHTVYLSRLCICPFRFWTLWGMSFETKISKLFSRYFRNQIKFLFILICLILAKPKIAICYYDFIYWCFLANFNIHTHKIMIGRHEVGIQLKIKLFLRHQLTAFWKASSLALISFR